MDGRMWFQILRFYIRIALFGDPVLRKPKAAALQPAKSTQLTQLRPLANAK